MEDKLRYQISTEISIKTKETEFRESGDIIMTGRVLGNDSQELSKNLKIIQKLCDQEGLEIWYETVE